MIWYQYTVVSIFLLVNHESKLKNKLPIHVAVNRQLNNRKMWRGKVGLLEVKGDHT